MGKMTEGPLWLFDIPRSRALLVVAHPDDETIFAGGLILTSSETRWTVVCCTSENDQRKRELLCACDFLAEKSGNYVSPEMLGFVPDCIDVSSLAKRLRTYAAGYDIVLTHNPKGEYGHNDHEQVHQCVIDSIANPNTWVFISPGSTNVNQEELKSKEPGGNVTVCLSPEIVSLKIRAFQGCHKSQAEIYGYDPNGTLRETDLRDTLSWEFESGREEYAFYR